MEVPLLLGKPRGLNCNLQIEIQYIFLIQLDSFQQDAFSSIFAADLVEQKMNLNIYVFFRSFADFDTCTLNF